MFAAPGAAPYHLAATYAANAVAWNAAREVALLTPSKAGGFAVGVVSRLASGPCGQHENGPYHFRWEQLDEDAATAHADTLDLPKDGSLSGTLAALSTEGVHPAIGMCREAIQRKHRLTGRLVFPESTVRDELFACFARFRRFARHEGTRLRAMTIHQAKNREFEGVIILWPYQVTSDAEQSRRLLYNAITRAQRWCTVIVQNGSMLQRPPFAPCASE